MEIGRITGADRTLSNIPKPIKFSYSPYTKTDFSLKTKTYCLLNKNNSNNPNDAKVFKVIILGDINVGKTSIVNRLCRNLFKTTYKATIGVDFEVEHFNILGVPLTLQIWDTAGQEKFKSIIQNYYRNAHAIVLVFDLSSIKTLYHCEQWLEEALQFSATTTPPYIFMVGTKKDLLSPQSYANTECIAKDIWTKLGAEFFPVSAKTGENINFLFQRIAALTFDDYIDETSCENDINKICGNPCVLRRNDTKKAAKICSAASSCVN